MTAADREDLIYEIEHNPTFRAQLRAALGIEGPSHVLNEIIRIVDTDQEFRDRLQVALRLRLGSAKPEAR